jgi:ATP-dependent DNA helicase RecG
MSGQLLNTVALTELAGVGAKMAEKLHKIGLNNVQDVLFHLPLRYEDRTRIWPINRVAPGQYLTVQGEVSHCSIQFGKRKMLTVKIGDGTGSVTLKFFNFNASMKNSFSDGKQVKAYGEIKGSQFGLEIIHPDYHLFSEPTALSAEETLTPVYPTTDGLRQTTLRNLTDQALSLLEKSAVTELLPAGLYDQQMTLAQALQVMHRPTPDISLEQFPVRSITGGSGPTSVLLTH